MLGVLGLVLMRKFVWIFPFVLSLSSFLVLHFVNCGNLGWHVCLCDYLSNLLLIFACEQRDPISRICNFWVFLA